jgi:hypothetical protein
MNSAFPKNYAIMLSTGRPADDEKIFLKIIPGKEVKRTFLISPAQFTE